MMSKFEASVLSIRCKLYGRAGYSEGALSRTWQGGLDSGALAVEYT